jgi:hypothetical protein
MAVKTIYITGTCKWAKLTGNDDKFKRWSISVFPDEPSWAVYHNCGLELKEREDEDGKFLQLGRPYSKIIKGEMVDFEEPEVHGSSPEELGNGSNVTCKVVVYDTVKGKGHRLEAVRVNSLVKYTKPEVDTSNEDSPF